MTGRCAARGRVLDVRVEADTYPIRGVGLQADYARNEQVPFVDVVATLDAGSGQCCALMLSRDLDAERELVLEWQDAAPTRVLACETLTGADPKAFNTFEQRRVVEPAAAMASAQPGTRQQRAQHVRGAQRAQGLRSRTAR